MAPVLTRTLNRSLPIHWAAAGLAFLLVLSVLALTPDSARAQVAPVGLGSADSFAVLAGQTVTNTGSTQISGDVGVSPGTAITGLTQDQVNGEIHEGGAVALQAQNDLTTAYNDAAGRTPATALPDDIGGQTYIEGVYRHASQLELTGTVTLDAQGDPDAVFIFQVGSAFITASGSRVSLINGAQACNVFWQVGSSATLGTNSTFVGNVLALTSIAAQSGTTVDGRLLAREGEVTLDNNTIQRADCDNGNGDNGDNGNGDNGNGNGDNGNGDNGNGNGDNGNGDNGNGNGDNGNGDNGNGDNGNGDNGNGNGDNGNGDNGNGNGDNGNGDNGNGDNGNGDNGDNGNGNGDNGDNGNGNGDNGYGGYALR
ncbi:ice-binding family protein [Nocardiopsis valliformis]|uniref:ice-binding family protein n=1 Tax=Nocardiopsis valliformis TaxID=239974 RepID=UPI00034AE210|nr:ice-binding family protein [Nocardiopsis valliformis]